MEKILVVDNNDSFVYNIVEILRGRSEVDVCLSKDLYIGIEDRYDKIILSPGAGLPSDYPDMEKLILRCLKTHPIFGVCLGFQALAVALGASLKQLSAPKHGHSSSLNIIDTNDVLLRGVPCGSSVGRYHSWVVDSNSVPKEMIITSYDEDDNIMSFSHIELPIYGVQFHPESIITEHGVQMLLNFVNV
ncbi:MAG: aminodeoxychorismate/anthranilate synthase component II [Rikenellaceae bacterium]